MYQTLKLLIINLLFIVNNYRFTIPGAEGIKPQFFHIILSNGC